MIFQRARIRKRKPACLCPKFYSTCMGAIFLRLHGIGIVRESRQKLTLDSFLKIIFLLKKKKDVFKNPAFCCAKKGLLKRSSCKDIIKDPQDWADVRRGWSHFFLCKKEPEDPVRKKRRLQLNIKVGQKSLKKIFGTQCQDSSALERGKLF